MADSKTVLAFGNPLWDVTITNESESLNLIQKYHLEADGQAEISRRQMNSLSQDIQGLEKYTSAGGSCQNSLRVLRWILKGKCHAQVFGSVGNDREAETLRETLKLDGVEPRYLVQPDLPTGKTVALVNGLKRSLVAHIGAAEVLPLESLLAYPNFTSILDTSNIVLIEAYFLTNRFTTVRHIVDQCKKTNKTMAFNLCGDYLLKIVPEPVKYLVKHAQIIFGNKMEYFALAKLLGKNCLEELATDLAKNDDRMVVITDGAHPVQCYNNTGDFQVEVPPMNSDEIKDTTGAGDAFIGGFLAGIILSKKVRGCIDMGIYAASNIIKQTGCSLPKYESGIILE